MPMALSTDVFTVGWGANPNLWAVLGLAPQPTL